MYVAGGSAIVVTEAFAGKNFACRISARIEALFSSSAKGNVNSAISKAICAAACAIGLLACSTAFRAAKIAVPEEIAAVSLPRILSAAFR